MVIALVTWWRPDLAPPSERAGWGERLRALARIWDMMALVLVVIGGIAIGWISPPEAASIGVAGALLISAMRNNFV